MCLGLYDSLRNRNIPKNRSCCYTIKRKQWNWQEAIDEALDISFDDNHYPWYHITSRAGRQKNKYSIQQSLSLSTCSTKSNIICCEDILTSSPLGKGGGSHEIIIFVFDAGIAFMSCGADGTVSWLR